MTEESSMKYYNIAFFSLLITCNVMDLFNDNWQQDEAWTMLFVKAVAMNATAKGALQQVTW